MWDQATLQPDARWDSLLGERSGQDIGQLWAGLSGQALADSQAGLLPPLRSHGVVVEGAEGLAEYLGTQVWTWNGDQATGVQVSSLYGGQHLVVSAWGSAPAVRVEPGELFGVLATTEPASGYTLTLVAPPPTVGPIDQVYPYVPSGPSLAEPTTTVSRSSRGCSVTGGSGWWWLAVVVLWRRRGA